jgi:hypothetical protein
MASSPLPPRLRLAALTALDADQRWGPDLLPLLLTCRGAQDDDELLRLMAPAALQKRGLFGRTLLMAAARFNDLRLATRILDARPSIMGPFREYEEPLRLEVTSQLWRDQVDILDTFIFGSALYFAASEGFTEMARLLVSRGLRAASLFSGDFERGSECGWTSSEPGWLRDVGGDFEEPHDITLSKYFKPLASHPALVSELVLLADEPDGCLAAALLGLEAVLVEKLPAFGVGEVSGLLRLAAKVGQHETVQLLFKDVRASTRAKVAAARTLRDLELVRACFELADADADALLCAACSVGDLRLVRLAIGRGADLDSSDGRIGNDGGPWLGREGIRLAFETAISGGHLNVVRFLCTHDAVHTRFALLAAIEIGDLDLVESIMTARGAGIVHQEWLHSSSRLPWAGDHCGPEVFEQESALSRAAEHGKLDILAWLVDVMGVDLEGALHRALGVACMGPSGLDPARNLDVARFLLARGAKTSFFSEEFESDQVYEVELICVAVRHGQDLILRELLLRDFSETTDSTVAAVNRALDAALDVWDLQLPSYREAGRVKCVHVLLAIGATKGVQGRRQASSDALRGALFDHAAVETVKRSLADKLTT